MGAAVVVNTPQWLLQRKIDVSDIPAAEVQIETKPAARPGIGRHFKQHNTESQEIKNSGYGTYCH